MSGEPLWHDGDAIGEKVPALFSFQSALVLFGLKLTETLAEHPFAAGVEDEMSETAGKTFKRLIDSFEKIFGALGEAVGLQGDRLQVVRAIGEQTEGDATALGGSWGGSGGGSRG
ncbi:hypothetical protein [Parafrankia elaeagni]|uniref:hypothetical protein n=1 Tax=Parafrankia elaeagni TaxID=222534 RepID=UPI0003797DA3|nr:hypothetical protein [Parafrankia elaeagni]